MKRNKVLCAILLMFLVNACTSTDTDTDTDTDRLVDQRIKARSESGDSKLEIKNIFSYVSKCNESANKSTEFCGCVSWAKDNSGKIPAPSFGANQKEYEDKASLALFDYFLKLDKCEQYAPVEIDFDIPANTALAIKTLERNSGRILSPDNLEKVEPVTHPKGWAYEMGAPDAKIDFSRQGFSFQGKDKDGDLFIYSHIYSGTKTEQVYISGIKYQRDKKEDPHVLIPSDDFDKCKFFIGSCVYGSADRRKKVVTIFENGVWIRNVAGIGFKRALKKTIYDMNGIPLYEFYQSQNYTREEIRHETNKGY